MVLCNGAGCIEEHAGFRTGIQSRCWLGVVMKFNVNAVSVPLHPEQCTLPYQLGLAVPQQQAKQKLKMADSFVFFLFVCL